MVPASLKVQSLVNHQAEKIAFALVSNHEAIGDPSPYSLEISLYIYVVFFFLCNYVI